MTGDATRACRQKTSAPNARVTDHQERNLPEQASGASSFEKARRRAEEAGRSFPWTTACIKGKGTLSYEIPPHERNAWRYAEDEQKLVMIERQSTADARAIRPSAHKRCGERCVRRAVAAEGWRSRPGFR